MLGLLRKKKKDAEVSEEEIKQEVSGESPSSEGDEGKGEKKEKPVEKTELTGGSGDIVKLSTEVDRIKASVEGFTEVRKAFGERMNGLSEQIGELRAMIMDRDRTIQEIELKAVKAADLVESVQPDKLMIAIQKEDAKFEALKANLEGNESIMDRIMEDLKEMRKRLEFFRGIEEIIKLSEEVKKELVEIKKVEGNIEINADKVNTIYSEMRKSLQEAELFSDKIREVNVSQQQNSKDIDNIKNKMLGLADKTELDKLVNKVQKYIDALQEINKKSSLSKDIGQLKVILEGMK